MIIYLLKSSLCLVLILSFYHLVLEHRKSLKVNRIYLLVGLVFSLIVPFVIINIGLPIWGYVDDLAVGRVLDSNNVQAIQPSLEMNLLTLIKYLYWSVTMTLFFRFSWKIYSFIIKIFRNEKRSILGVFLVYLPENTLPFTFFNYIFVPKKDFEENTLENEILTHELVHAHQNHTIDVLFVEFIRIVFWFNPIFYFYKKAIQLNHEFLADEGVNKKHNKVKDYQHLLLSKINTNKHVYLASNLHFKFTKKRLIMMNKSSSRRNSLINISMIIPLFIALFFIFSSNATGQNTTINEGREKVLNDYFQNTHFTIESKNGKKVSKEYKDLTNEEKLLLPPLPPLPPPAPKNGKKPTFAPLPAGSEVVLTSDGKVIIKSSWQGIAPPPPPPPPPAPVVPVEKDEKDGKGN